MTIDEWLHRLNLLHLKPNFEKQKIRRIGDLAYIEDLREYNLTDGKKLSMRRIQDMIQGETDTKEKFKYLNKHGIQLIGSIFLKNQRELKEMVNSVPEDTLTGFQLRDIFYNSKDTKEIRKKIYEAVIFNKSFNKLIRHNAG